MGDIISNEHLKFDGTSTTRRIASREKWSDLQLLQKRKQLTPQDTDIVYKLADSGTMLIPTDQNDNKETYDAAGIAKIEYRGGYIQTLNYTSSKLTSISDSYGRSISITYNADDLIETITDPDNKVYAYTYVDAYSSLSAASKKLSTVTTPITHPVSLR